MLLKAILFVSFSVLGLVVGNKPKTSLKAHVCGGELFDDRCKKVSCDLKLFACTKEEPKGASWDGGCYMCDVKMSDVMKQAKALFEKGEKKKDLPEGCLGHRVGKTHRVMLKDTKAKTMVFFTSRGNWEKYEKVTAETKLSDLVEPKHAGLNKRDVVDYEVALRRRNVFKDLVDAVCYVVLSPVGIVLGLLTIVVAVILTVLAAPFIMLGIV